MESNLRSSTSRSNRCINISFGMQQMIEGIYLNTHTMSSLEDLYGFLNKYDNVFCHRNIFCDFLSDFFFDDKRGIGENETTLCTSSKNFVKCKLHCMSRCLNFINRVGYMKIKLSCDDLHFEIRREMMIFLWTDYVSIAIISVIYQMLEWICMIFRI